MSEETILPGGPYATAPASEAPAAAPASTAATQEADPSPRLGASSPSSTAVTAQHCSCGGSGGDCSCSSSPPVSYVMALGTVRPSLPNEGLLREFDLDAQKDSVAADSSMWFSVLTQGQNLYLAREVCWIFRVDGIDTYLLRPRSYVELNELVMTTEPTQHDEDRYVVVVGPRGPVAPPELCGGLELPIVVSNKVHSFTTEEFAEGMKKALEDECHAVNLDCLRSFFQDITTQLSDNAGDTDEHRALNYVVLRYTGVYLMASNQLEAGYKFASVRLAPAPVQGTRRAVDVSFRWQKLDGLSAVDFTCRVDVTGQFPFLTSPLVQSYPRL